VKAKSNTEEKEPSVTFSLRLPKTLHLALKKMAKDGKRSLNKQVEWLIETATSKSPDSAIKPLQTAKAELRDQK
jgi:predicted HicB family RNase H-like nuclease